MANSILEKYNISLYDEPKPTEKKPVSVLDKYNITLGEEKPLIGEYEAPLLGPSPATKEVPYAGRIPGVTVTEKKVPKVSRAVGGVLRPKELATEEDIRRAKIDYEVAIYNTEKLTKEKHRGYVGLKPSEQRIQRIKWGMEQPGLPFYTTAEKRGMVFGTPRRALATLIDKGVSRLQGTPADKEPLKQLMIEAQYGKPPADNLGEVVNNVFERGWQRLETIPREEWKPQDIVFAKLYGERPFEAVRGQLSWFGAKTMGDILGPAIDPVQLTLYITGHQVAKAAWGAAFSTFSPKVQQAITRTFYTDIATGLRQKYPTLYETKEAMTLTGEDARILATKVSRGVDLTEQEKLFYKVIKADDWRKIASIIKGETYKIITKKVPIARARLMLRNLRGLFKGIQKGDVTTVMKPMIKAIGLEKAGVGIPVVTKEVTAIPSGVITKPAVKPTVPLPVEKVTPPTKPAVVPTEVKPEVTKDIGKSFRARLAIEGIKKGEVAKVLDWKQDLKSMPPNRAGYYRIELEDGTKIWSNAEEFKRTMLPEKEVKPPEKVIPVTEITGEFQPPLEEYIGKNTYDIFDIGEGKFRVEMFLKTTAERAKYGKPEMVSEGTFDSLEKARDYIKTEDPTTKLSKRYKWIKPEVKKEIVKPTEVTKTYKKISKLEADITKEEERLEILAKEGAKGAPAPEEPAWIKDIPKIKTASLKKDYPDLLKDESAKGKLMRYMSTDPASSSIDEIASDLSRQYGKEITEQNIIDAILRPSKAERLAMAQTEAEEFVYDKLYEGEEGARLREIAEEARGLRERLIGVEVKEFPEVKVDRNALRDFPTTRGTIETVPKVAGSIRHILDNVIPRMANPKENLFGFTDLKGFKKIDNLLGHNKGDEVLLQMAKEFEMFEGNGFSKGDNFNSVQPDQMRPIGYLEKKLEFKKRIESIPVLPEVTEKLGIDKYEITVAIGLGGKELDWWKPADVMLGNAKEKWMLKIGDKEIDPRSSVLLTTDAVKKLGGKEKIVEISKNYDYNIVEAKEGGNYELLRASSKEVTEGIPARERRIPQEKAKEGYRRREGLPRGVREEAEVKPPKKEIPPGPIGGGVTPSEAMRGHEWYQLPKIQGFFRDQDIVPNLIKLKQGQVSKGIIKAIRKKAIELGISDHQIETILATEFPDLRQKIKKFTGDIMSIEAINELYAQAIDQAVLPSEKIKLQKELKFIGGTITTPSEMRRLRRLAHAWLFRKGMTLKAFRDIVHKVTGHWHTTHKDITAEQLKEVIAKIKKVRPKTIGYKTVVTAKTEKQIQTFKDNLIGKGELTEDIFKNILRSENIKYPGWVHKENFITQTQGKNLLRRMADEAPIYKREIATEKALEKFPKVKKHIDRFKAYIKRKSEAIAKSGRGVTVFTLKDWRFVAMDMQEGTGDPFYETYKTFESKRRKVNLQNDDILNRVERVGGKNVERILRDEEAVQRIDDWIGSFSKESGAPVRPKNITSNELAMAKEIQKILEEFQSKIRVLRFFDWRAQGAKIPDATEAQLKEAETILETEGYDALLTHLNKQDWGVIKSGYDIREVIRPKIRIQKMKPAPGKRHLKIQEGIVYIKSDRNIMQRLASYVKQINNRYELMPEVNALRSLFENNYSKFKEPQRVSDAFVRLFREAYGMRNVPSALMNFVTISYAQSMRSVFLDAYKYLRNLQQNPAFYASPQDFKHAFKTMTKEEADFFLKEVSQMGGMKHDYLMQQTGLPGFGKINNIVDGVNLYPKTDDINRAICFKSKLGRIKEAIRKYGDDIDKIIRATGFGDLELGQRMVALQILATEGKTAMVHYVAGEVTKDIHFIYERAARGPAEQGDDFSRVFSNLLTFRKGYIQRWYNNMNKLRISRKGVEAPYGARRRAFRVFMQLTLVATLAGWVFKKAVGKKRNPYSPLTIVEDFSLGGLATGTQEQIGELTHNTMSALKGDKEALGRVINNIPRSANLFIPFYRTLIDVVESTFGYQNIDVASLRQIRSALDKRYKAKGMNYYKIERDAIEKLQHALFGSWVGEKPKKSGGTTTIGEFQEAFKTRK